MNEALKVKVGSLSKMTGVLMRRGNEDTDGEMLQVPVNRGLTM